MADTEHIRVSVVYALADHQERVQLTLEEGATVALAIERSGLLTRVPGSSKNAACAIYGRAATLQTVLHDGDRVEILRPLAIDPKLNRRLAAERARRG